IPARSGETELCEQAVIQGLTERGRLKPQGLERAMRLKDGRDDARLLPVLSMLGLVSEREIAEAIAVHLQLPLTLARDFPFVAVLEETVSKRFLSEFHVLPLSDEPEGVALVMADPTNKLARDAIRLRTGKKLLTRVRI